MYENNIVNCIIWGNKCNEEYIELTHTTGNCNVSYSAIHGGYSGTANINIELDNNGEAKDVNYINFIDPEHDVFELSENSVAVNAGNNSATNIQEFDINGKQRINDGTIDMGAYEQNCLKYRYVAKSMAVGQSVPFYGSTITEPGRYEKRWALDASCDSLVVMDVRISGAIYYVTETGAGTKDGSSWENAGNDVNVAITNMYNTSGVDDRQVWIAAGTYKGNANNVAFPMLAGVTVYGGFAGNETSLAQRDIENNKTILTATYNGQTIVAPSPSYPGTAELPAVWNGIHFCATIGKVQLAENNTLENCIVSVGAEMNNATVKNCIFRDITNQSNRVIANASTLKGCKFYDNTFKYTYNSYGFITLNDATLDSCYVYSCIF